jgi:hypothetical protein
MLAAAIGGTAMEAVGGLQAASSQEAVANAQADALTQSGNAEARVAERQADDVLADAQRQAIQEARTAALAKSTLLARAGASGSGAADATVLDLGAGIEREGQLNEQMVLARGLRDSDATRYQGQLTKWQRGNQATNTRMAGQMQANATRIGVVSNVLQSAASMGSKYPMARRGGTGYG